MGKLHKATSQGDTHGQGDPESHGQISCRPLGRWRRSESLAKKEALSAAGWDEAGEASVPAWGGVCTSLGPSNQASVPRRWEEEGSFLIAAWR